MHSRARVHARFASRTLGFLLGLALASLPVGCATQGTRGELASNARRCADASLAVEVLGSGGPVADDGRASSGYLLWHEGRARLLIDAGGGVFLRFAESGARVEELDGLLLSHMHVDHVGDVPALLKSAFFGDRRRPLPVIGPSGDENFPTVSEHLRAMFDPSEGAYRYLSGYVDGSEGGRLAPLEITEVAVDEAATHVSLAEDLDVAAVGVPHGIVPALGFVVRVAGVRVAFAGDQRLDDPRFRELARGVDVLVAHHAIPEAAEGIAAQLHARPSAIGDFAAAVEPHRLVLSHHMARSLRELPGALELIGERYAGPVDVAEDHTCVIVAR